MPRACLCGRPAKEGYDSCERHIRRGAWKGGKKYQRSYDSVYQSARSRLLATVTPETRCALCGLPAIHLDGWQMDHIVPASRGGTSTLANLQIVHASCNRRRGARLGAETSAKRRREKDRALDVIPDP
jgi:5-methylcytosine-specific restriction endonuclease McrA